MIQWNEVSAKSSGGTELMARRLESFLPSDLMENFQIIPSRVRELDESKLRILWCHDLPHDPESQHLRNEGWRKFHKIVFVSHWQKEWYVREFQIPYSRVAVLQNAITPIETVEKPTTGIHLIYHTTPHRGLNILYQVYDALCKTYDDIHLDVFSSFELYGWKQRDGDDEIKPILDAVRQHKRITYHGFKPNADIRAALQKAHIFAYPNIWMETSCLSLMEALSAECACVHPDFGALPETAANWTFMYPFHEDINKHADIFYAALKTQIDLVREGTQALKLRGAKNYADLFYNWEIRKLQWENLLRGLLDLPREIDKPVQVFQYRSLG